MKTFVIAFIAGLGALLLAPEAQAQFIDCGPGGADCTETLYGFGNPPPQGPFTLTQGLVRTLPSGACRTENTAVQQGQVRIREQNNCVVSPTTRCPVEVPNIEDDSVTFAVVQLRFSVGPLGLLAIVSARALRNDPNLGFRELSGTCNASGDDCSLDSDCDPGDVCRSTCFSDPGTACGIHADCPNLDCRTQLDWDGIGFCSNELVLTQCNTDADCPGEETCLGGFTRDFSENSGGCCQSTTGAGCGTLFGTPEYPALDSGKPAPRRNNFEAPVWLFEGGRATPWDLDVITVPGQQEGICSQNITRACGANGDLETGAQNGKCTSGTNGCAAAPFDPADPALPSACDDVAFGGIAGDVCDFSEDFYRNTSELLINGSPDPTKCGGGTRFAGRPGEMCALPFDIPDGDPQPGCALINFGIIALPDIDCDGIDDTTQGRCTPLPLQQLPPPAPPDMICDDPSRCPSCTQDSDCASGNCINNGDLCPFLAEFNWFLDSNNDDIGDQCQCGDGNADGAITGVDIGAVALCANDPLAGAFCDATIVDATGDNATTAEDIGGIVAAVNGTIPTSALECLRNSPPAP